MGQAKNRGDFETRKAESIERKRVELEKKLEAERIRLANMTEEERELERRRKQRASEALSLMLACSSLFPFRVKDFL